MGLYRLLYSHQYPWLLILDRTIVGSYIHALAKHVAGDSPPKRLYGLLWNSKMVDGVVVSATRRTPEGKQQASTFITATYVLADGGRKLKELNSRSVLPGPVVAMASTAAATTTQDDEIGTMTTTMMTAAAAAETTTMTTMAAMEITTTTMAEDGEGHIGTTVGPAIAAAMLPTIVIPPPVLPPVLPTPTTMTMVGRTTTNQPEFYATTMTTTAATAAITTTTAETTTTTITTGPTPVLTNHRQNWFDCWQTARVGPTVAERMCYVRDTLGNKIHPSCINATTFFKNGYFHAHVSTIAILGIGCSD